MTTVAPRPGLVMIRFTMTSPFFMLSMSYGPFYDANADLWFVSLDHWIGWNMLAREEHRREIMNTPNAYLAHLALQRVLTNAHAFGNDPVVIDGWEDERDSIMARGVHLKYSQNLGIRDLLLRTRTRPIEDHSRRDETHWCFAAGLGNDRHAAILMELREKLRSGRPGETAG